MICSIQEFVEEITIAVKSFRRKRKLSLDTIGCPK
jgi:hypothetical protein